MIIDIHDVWDDAKVDHEKYVRERVRQALTNELSRGSVSPVLSDFERFVATHLDDIVDSCNSDYSGAIADFDNLFIPRSKTAKEAKALAKRIFNYDEFCEGKHQWTAYALCSKARCSVCPYCHISPIQTVVKSTRGKGYRPQLDHFLARSQFPYLALSLGNLVPCCGDCNGPSMKHTKNFYKIPHLNPLRDASALTFCLGPADGVKWSPTMQAMREPAANYGIAIVPAAGSAEANNSLVTFQLESRYKPYRNNAFRAAIAAKSQAWTASVKKETNLAITVETQLGFSEIGDGYKKEPTGKMLLDVYKASKI